jgi:glycerol uptake facilitator-like aquaporin
MPMGKRAAAELLGTVWLVFGGCGSAVLSAAFPNVGIVCTGFRARSGSACSPWRTRLGTFRVAI